MAKKLPASIPRIALTPAEAAAAIGVGPDFFEANVAPELRLVRRGSKAAGAGHRAGTLDGGERGAGAGGEALSRAVQSGDEGLGLRDAF